MAQTQNFGWENKWSTKKKRHKKYFFTQLTVSTTLTEFFTEVLSCNTDAWLITWLARMITWYVVVYMGRSRIWEKKRCVRQEWQSARRVTFLLLICKMNKVPGKSSSIYFNHNCPWIVDLAYVIGSASVVFRP